jgi:hypothetical protein
LAFKTTIAAEDQAMTASLRTTAAALLLGLVPMGHAVASDSCDQLRFQFATLSDNDEPNVEADKYARAIDAQKQSLAAVDLTLRKTGCSSGSLMVIGGPNARECEHLGVKRDRMKRNLEILENKHASLMSENAVNTRRQIIDALRQNRCNEEPQLVSTPGEDGTQALVRDDPNGFETIRVPSDEPDYIGSQFVDLGGTATNGNLRTMCVRTCDGAYFPISSHASPLNFQRDAQVCSMMCPGAETELYYHPLMSESSEMRSAVTGHAYADLPTAYKFRVEKPGSQPQCGCDFSLYYREMMKRQSYVADPASIPKTESSIVWVKPALRPSLKKDMVAENVARPKVRDYVPDDRIRVIGPKFFPDKRIDFTKSPTETR